MKDKACFVRCLALRFICRKSLRSLGADQTRALSSSSTGIFGMVYSHLLYGLCTHSSLYVSHKRIKLLGVAQFSMSEEEEEPNPLEASEAATSRYLLQWDLSYKKGKWRRHEATFKQLNRITIQRMPVFLTCFN